jgi:ribose 5-phosphate isomerase
MTDIEKQLKNWILSLFQNAASTIAKDAVKQFVNQKDMQVIGLGSGPMAAEIVRQMKNCIKNKKTIECVVTSLLFR